MRELLFVVLTVGLGLASLRAGGMLASAALCIAITVLLAIAIIAFVGRDQLKCFATGFLIPVIAYAGLHIAAGNAELDPYEGKLPTTRVLQPMFEVVVTRSWVDLNTGKALPNYNPAAFPDRHQGSPMLPAGMSPVTVSESPDRTTFMTLGHVLMAMLLGYVGGKFAVVIQRHQKNSESKD
jgi:hypothetical protein